MADEEDDQAPQEETNPYERFAQPQREEANPYAKFASSQGEENPYAKFAPKEEAPSAVGSAVRGVLRGAIPMTAGILGGAAGAAVGGAAGGAAGTAVPVVGNAIGAGVGGFGGALIGYGLASSGARGAQDIVTDTLGIDSPESRAADAAAHPYITEGAELATGLGSMSTSGKLAARVAAGGILGGFDLLQQGYNKGISNIDPAEAAIAAGFGAAAPTPRAWTQKAISPIEQGAAKFFGQTPAGTVAGEHYTPPEPPTWNPKNINSERPTPPPGPAGYAEGNVAAIYDTPSRTPANDGVTRINNILSDDPAIQAVKDAQTPAANSSSNQQASEYQTPTPIKPLLPRAPQTGEQPFSASDPTAKTSLEPQPPGRTPLGFNANNNGVTRLPPGLGNREQAAIPDDLSIPDFLRRGPKSENLPAEKTELQNFPAGEVGGQNENVRNLGPLLSPTEEALIETSRAQRGAAQNAREKAAQGQQGEAFSETSPAEDEAIAAMQPKPQSLSGGATEGEISTAPKNYPGVGARPLTLPENQTPAEQAANAFQERVRRDQKTREAEDTAAIDKLQAAAKQPIFGRQSRAMDKMYNDLENGRPLSEAHQEIHDKLGLEDIRKRLQDFHDTEIAAGRMRDVGQLDENYTPKVTTKQWAKEVGDAKYSNADPVGGNMRFLRQNYREGDVHYLQIRDAQGNTRIISSDPYSEDFHVWDKGEAKKISNQTELAKGVKVKVDGKDWTVEPATTDAIEAAGVKDADGDPVRFVRSPVAFLRAERAMNEVQRNRAILDHIRTDPAYKDIQITPNGSKKLKDLADKNGWVESDVPELKGTYFDPNMAHALNDFHQPGFNIDLGGLGKAMAGINRFLTSSIFWNPIPHLFNTGYHWAVARGTDWLIPTSYMRLASTGINAIREVITQGPLYRQMLREGTPFMWPAIDSANMMRTLGKLGEVAIQQDPTFWNQAAKMMGLKHGSELVKLWYEGARRVLWQGGDVFTMQRVLENMQKGMTTPEAIAATRTHLPDYTIPYQVMGQRWLSQLLQDPRNPVSVFNRYHYGMFKSLAKITHDTVMPNVPWEMRKEAIGNALALATLTFVVKPALDAAWQKITGNKDAEARPRGPLAPIYAAKELVQGKRDVASAFGTAFTMSPFMRMTIDALTNQDWKHKTIITPGSGPLHQVSELGGHAANYLAPVNTFGKHLMPKAEKGGLGRELAAQIGDYKDPSTKQLKGQKAGEKMRKDEAKKRLKKPDNAVEYGLNKLFGYAQGGPVKPTKFFRRQS